MKVWKTRRDGVRQRYSKKRNLTGKYARKREFRFIRKKWDSDELKEGFKQIKEDNEEKEKNKRIKENWRLGYLELE